MAAVHPRFRCLELVPLHWRTASEEDYCDYAILHEIWAGGGLFQVDEAPAAGTPVRITLPHAELDGITGAYRIESGTYLIEVAVNAATDWLGGRFRPSVLLPIDAENRPPLRLAS